MAKMQQDSQKANMDLVKQLQTIQSERAKFELEAKEKSIKAEAAEKARIQQQLLKEQEESRKQAQLIADQ